MNPPDLRRLIVQLRAILDAPPAGGPVLVSGDELEALLECVEALEQTYDLLKDGEATNALHALDAFLIRLHHPVEERNDKQI